MKICAAVTSRPNATFIPAHLTLFHHLPDQPDIAQTLHETACVNRTFQLTEPAPRSIGRGVAVFFRSAPLSALHTTLSAAFEAHLIPQDRQRFQPHIVVQNKVDAEIARQTLPQVQAILLAEPQAIGFSLWRYLGGPWEHLRDFPFVASA